MNEFIEQFLIEARELVEQATADLLAIEERPDDRARLDSAFRAFHTLKGSAGIVEFPAMARAMHVAEDALGGLRGGGGRPGSKLFGNCLACLDQVVQWLDYMEEHGELPPEAEAEAGADALLRRFGADGEEKPPTAEARTDPAPEDWLEDLLARHRGAAESATAAVRYLPDPDCFFRGEDPLAILRGLPGVLAIEIAPRGEWPALDGFDPYVCSTWFSALLSSSPEEVSDRLVGLGRQVEVRALWGRAGVSPAVAAITPAARALLLAQVQLLREDGAEGVAGRLGSAGRVAASVLRQCGLAADAGRIERTAAESQVSTNPERLAAAIERCLHGEAALEWANEQRARTPDLPDTAVRTLRVDVGRVDALVRLTGEFTVAVNALAHAAGLAREGNDSAGIAGLLQDQHAILDRLLRDLQRSVLDLRVLPLRHVFQRFPRLVREIAADLGKPAQLVIAGEETEADKAIVEGLSEPLLHLVRNAIDHGIESAPDRAADGKPATATIRLRASRVGEHVLVEVEDDGRGIESAAVRRAATDRGIASADELSAIRDEDVVQLIFAPGLSTAPTTTALSGRGVGMDVVRATVERLGGHVGVESRPKQGTTIRLTLPFTVMMTRVMTVEAGGQVFGIPLDNVVETLRLPPDRIIPVGEAHAFVLRHQTVPLISLASELGQDEAAGSEFEASVVVVRIGGGLAGLKVDRLGVRMDVMLRPVEGLLAGMRGIAGTTLLGDGRVLIVVDVQDLLA